MDTNPPKSLPAVLADSFVYPVRGSGWMLILGGTIVLFSLNMLGHYSRFMGLVLILSGIRRLLVMYVLAYFMRVLADSAGGSDSPPDWPTLRDVWDDIVYPFLLFALAVAAAFVPLVATNIVLYQAGEWPKWQGIFGPLLAGPGAQDGLGVFILRVAALAAGLIPLPMALVGVALCDSPAGLNPLRTIPAICRIGLPYTLVLVLLAAMCCGGYYVIGTLGKVPVLGGLVAVAAVMYAGIVTARTLGLTYHRYAKLLRWFE